MSKVKSQVKSAYSFLVVGNQKAIVAGVVALVAGLGLQVNGVNLLDATVREVVVAGVNAVVAAGAVWLKANR